ncbi:MAG: hypothetical protein KDC91_11600, partial [Flavobacteriaceae bacterium]|nr:hypothetical protein [Flavobacteriaceae bacterium]
MKLAYEVSRRVHQWKKEKKELNLFKHYTHNLRINNYLCSLVHQGKNEQKEKQYKKERKGIYLNTA